MHHLKLSSPLLGDYETDSFPISVGRSSSCDFVIPNNGVSRIHAQIFLEADSCVLYDEGSANGTFVSGQKVAESAVLESGMRIQFGTCDFTVHMTVDSAPEAGFDTPHHINTPSPSSETGAGDEYTQMLGRSEVREQNNGIPASDEVDPPTEMFSMNPPPKRSFFAANWPWIILALLVPLIGWAATQFFG